MRPVVAVTCDRYSLKLQYTEQAATSGNPSRESTYAVCFYRSQTKCALGLSSVSVRQCCTPSIHASAFFRMTLKNEYSDESRGTGISSGKGSPSPHDPAGYTSSSLGSSKPSKYFRTKLASFLNFKTSTLNPLISMAIGQIISKGTWSPTMNQTRNRLRSWGVGLNSKPYCFRSCGGTIMVGRL